MFTERRIRKTTRANLPPVHFKNAPDKLSVNLISKEFISLLTAWMIPAYIINSRAQIKSSLLTAGVQRSDIMQKNHFSDVSQQ